MMYVITKVKDNKTTVEKIANRTEAISCFMALISNVVPFAEISAILEDDGQILEWAGCYGSTVSLAESV